MAAHTTRYAALLMMALSYGCQDPRPEPEPVPVPAAESTESERVMSAARAALRHSRYGSHDLELRIDVGLKRWTNWIAEYDRKVRFENSPAGKALKGKMLVVVYASPKSTYDPNAAFNIITADGDAWVLMDIDDLSCAFVIRG